MRPCFSVRLQVSSLLHVSWFTCRLSKIQKIRKIGFGGGGGIKDQGCVPHLDMLETINFVSPKGLLSVITIVLGVLFLVSAFVPWSSMPSYLGHRRGTSISVALSNHVNTPRPPLLFFPALSDPVSFLINAENEYNEFVVISHSLFSMSQTSNVNTHAYRHIRRKKRSEGFVHFSTHS